MWTLKLCMLILFHLVIKTSRKNISPNKACNNTTFLKKLPFFYFFYFDFLVTCWRRRREIDTRTNRKGREVAEISSWCAETGFSNSENETAKGNWTRDERCRYQVKVGNTNHSTDLNLSLSHTHPFVWHVIFSWIFIWNFRCIMFDVCG